MSRAGGRGGFSRGDRSAGCQSGKGGKSVGRVAFNAPPPPPVRYLTREEPEPSLPGGGEEGVLFASARCTKRALQWRALCKLAKQNRARLAISSALDVFPLPFTARGAFPFGVYRTPDFAG